MPISIKQHKPRNTGLKVDRRIEPTIRVIPLKSRQWRKLRDYVLMLKPLCAECERFGILEPAKDVDHHDNNPNNNDIDNLVGLCHQCHSRKTRLWMNERGKNHQKENDVDRAPRHTHKVAL